MTSALQRLYQHEESPCMTLYMPVVSRGKETRQNAIRFKNHLAEAERAMADFQPDETARKKFLAPLRELVENGVELDSSDRSLAIFRSPSFFEILHLAYEPGEECTVSNSFNLTPLIPLLSEGRPVYALMADEHQVQLLRMEGSNVEEIDLGSCPRSLEEAVKLDDPQQALQYHSGKGRTPQYHGQGGDQERHDEDLHHFASAVARHVGSVLEPAFAPLYLCAPDPFAHFLRESLKQTNAGLREAALEGHPQSHTTETLLDQIRSRRAEEMKQERESALDQLSEAIAKGKGMRELPESALAAKEGRVSTAIIDERELIADDHAHDHVHRARLSTLAFETVLHGGTLHLSPGSDLPQDTAVLAELRY